MRNAKQRAVSKGVRSITDELAEPFAKALATFVKEAGGAGRSEESRRMLLERLRSSESLNRAGREHAKKLYEEYEQLAKEGKAEPPLKFSDIPKPKPTLRALLWQKGMSQKDLAEKARMDPAVVSRVLKNPDHSKVATVKRIAHALGVHLADVNLDAA